MNWECEYFKLYLCIQIVRQVRGRNNYLLHSANVTRRMRLLERATQRSTHRER